MGMTYEETKQRKLQRMLGLRIMNAVGMISWAETRTIDAVNMLVVWKNSLLCDL